MSTQGMASATMYISARRAASQSSSMSVPASAARMHSKATSRRGARLAAPPVPWGASVFSSPSAVMDAACFGTLHGHARGPFGGAAASSAPAAADFCAGLAGAPAGELRHFRVLHRAHSTAHFGVQGPLAAGETAAVPRATPSWRSAPRLGRLVALSRAFFTSPAASFRRSATSGAPGATGVPARPAELAAVEQAPNYPATWSKTQNPRVDGMSGPRFEQTDLAAQPRPLAAIKLIADEPVRVVSGAKIWCDGGHGAVGHPKVYINLESGKPVACGYCGIRFQQADSEHAH